MSRTLAPRHCRDRGFAVDGTVAVPPFTRIRTCHASGLLVAYWDWLGAGCHSVIPPASAITENFGKLLELCAWRAKSNHLSRVSRSAARSMTVVVFCRAGREQEPTYASSNPDIPAFLEDRPVHTCMVPNLPRVRRSVGGLLPQFCTKVPIDASPR